MAGDGHFDLIVIGSGPGGQKAAIQGAKAGRSVLLIERGREIGGACVHKGTIPSKTLRETAVWFGNIAHRGGGAFHLAPPEEVRVQSLITRLRDVIVAHERFLAEQVDRNRIEYRHGRASFVDPHHVAVQSVRGDTATFSADFVVVACGSIPRTPDDVPIDHEHILDSDSILSLTYLPRSLTVLGGGVIASEYASIFAELGTEVTMIDRGARPLAFLDEELTSRFVARFEAHPACRFLGSRQFTEVAWDGVSRVVTTLPGGETVRTEKMLVALGRIANLRGLGTENIGLEESARGLIEVDEHCRTKIPSVYAVGDVIGPPSLASTSMEQGRRAVCHAFGLPVGDGVDTTPSGIYTIPDISTVGLTEQQVVAQHGSAVCGEARFDELARAHISGSTDGYLKIVCDPTGRRLLGAQIYGEGATELIHLAQMAMLTGADVDLFVDNIFNFPTYAEAYRVAAFSVVQKRQAMAELACVAE